jgi:hypothetical protein
MNGSGTSYSLSQSPSITGSRNYSVGVYDINNNLKSSLFNGSYEVKKPNSAPTLNLINSSTTAITGSTYTVQLQGNDVDNNLSSITIYWGDGTSNSQNTASGSTLTFIHTYNTANSYTWSATAYDSVNASSDNVAKTVSVFSQITIPSISSASASPTATTVGNSINFSATLSSNLPSGYSVKLNYGNTSISMSGSGTNYSVVQTPTIQGQQVFTVGVYDANNNLKGNVFTSNFEIVKANTVPTLSFISGNSTTTAGTSYSVQLQANDIDNNLKSIKVVWGDGATDTQNATNGSTLTFTHTYATANTYNWSATALDSGNASSTAIVKNVSVSPAVVTPPVSTSGYSKISNSGATLPDTAVLGSGSNDWACTKDNKTGLIWEVKTTDGGLRDKNQQYTNYISGEKGFGLSTNSDYLISTVNKKTLCGASNWRMPNIEELKNIITCSDGEYNPVNEGSSGYVCLNGDKNSVYKPTINTTYFPNTQKDWYWSSSASYSSFTWVVYFYSGYSGGYAKTHDSYVFVRLVRDDLPPSTSNYIKISNTGTSLPDSALLGSGPSDWACTKDNKTGLIWEVKTNEGGIGLRDMSKIYTNWFVGEKGYGVSVNSDYFINAVNKQTLCGAANWRLPTNEELRGLIVCSDGKYIELSKDEFGAICSNTDTVTKPTINIAYFPNTQGDSFWSSTTYADSVFNVTFWGFSGYSSKSSKIYIRLVH